jgi:chromosome segregation ATPase
MESAMVETTNDTDIDTIQMEQYAAEFNVAMAAFNAFNKYAMIAEYAQCDVDEFVQESLDEKIDKVDDWKNSGGKAKKALGSAASALLKMIRAVTNFFKRLFGKETNPFARLAKALRKRKALKSGHGMAIDTKKVRTDVDRRIADNEEKAKLRKELESAKSQLASEKEKNAKLEDGIKKLGLQVADWRAQYESVLKALDEANAALEALKKAKSESDAALDKANERIEKADAILTQVSNISIYKKNVAKKVSAQASEYLYGGKAPATIDEVASECDNLDKMSRQIPEKTEKLETALVAVKENGFMPPAVITKIEKVVSAANGLGQKTVKTVAEIQKDPVIAQFSI